MTTQRSGDGTAKYQPPAASGFNPDVFGLSRPAQIIGQGEPRSTPRFAIYKLDKDGDVYYWRIELYDTRGGLNLQRGRFDEAHDRLASSSLDTRFRQRLILPQLTTSAATPDPEVESAYGIRGANIFGTLMIAAGGSLGTGPVIFKETSSTNPALVSVAYAPTTAHSITSGQALILNGASYFIVGFDLGVAQAFPDAAGSAPTAMHASTSGCYGIIQTPINDNALLIYSNDNIYTLASSSAVAAAPTVALANVPRGGWALGLLGLGGGPLRAWWVWPTISAGLNHDADAITEYVNARGPRLISTNMQGTDPQELRLTDLTGLTEAMIIRDGIVATDATSVVFHSGRYVENLHWNADPPANSDRERLVIGMWAVGGDLYVEVNERATTNGTGNTKRWVEHYNFEIKAWHRVSAEETLSTTGILSFGAGHSLPVSKNTGFLHGRANGAWKRIFQPPPGTNPYTLRKTSGAQASTGATFEATGTATWPAVQIPGLEGWALAVRRISGNPQIEIGGGTPTTYPSVAVSCGGVSATFVYGQTQGRQEFQFFNNENVVYELQPVITLTQQAGGTDPTRTTPQALPIIIEGIARRPEFDKGSEIGDWTR